MAGNCDIKMNWTSTRVWVVLVLNHVQTYFIMLAWCWLHMPKPDINHVQRLTIWTLSKPTLTLWQIQHLVLKTTRQRTHMCMSLFTIRRPFYHCPSPCVNPLLLSYWTPVNHIVLLWSIVVFYELGFQETR